MRRALVLLWCLPTTLVGGVVALLGSVGGGSWRRVDGVLEVDGRALAWMLRRWVPIRGGAAALTLGHVVLGRDRACLDRTRVHERVHVAQAERWGPLFVPAYLVGGFVAWLRGGHPYRDNPFEREAFAAEAGSGVSPSPGVDMEF